MTSFKDMVAADRAATFLNPEEFGETHSIEGASITVVIDDYALREKSAGATLSIAEADLVLYARTEDLPEERAAGATLNLDGCEYIVVDWSADMGITSVTLSGARAI